MNKIIKKHSAMGMTEYGDSITVKKVFNGKNMKIAELLKHQSEIDIKLIRREPFLGEVFPDNYLYPGTFIPRGATVFMDNNGVDGKITI